MAEDRKRPRDTEEEAEVGDRITLTTVDGGEFDFVIQAIAKIEHKEYAVLTPCEPGEHCAADEVLIMRVVADEGEDILVEIEDDAEFERVARAFEEQEEAEAGDI